MNKSWERVGFIYARVAIGAAFLSAVAARFGLWSGGVDMSHFSGFIKYTGEVNSFLPASVIPFMAWAATISETGCGLLLIAGLWPRWVALASAALLAYSGRPWRFRSASNRRWIIRCSLLQVGLCR